MVYSITKRRREEATAPQGPFARLPDETILNVTQYLSTEDVLNLKLSFQRMVGACNTTVAKRCKVLYLHPSKHALNTFFEICDHEIIRGEVETLVLLGKDMWPAISRQFPSLRLYRSTPGPSWPSQFRTWPATVAKPAVGRKTVNIAKDHSTNHDQEVPFDIAYRAVIEAIQRLPNLREVALEQSTDRSAQGGSLNMVTNSRIDTHAHKCAKSGSDGRRGSHCRSELVRLSDAEVLFGICLNTAKPIEALKMETPPPFLQQEAMFATDLIDRSHNRFSRLASLDIAIDRYQDDLPVAPVYRKLINLASSTLESLRIDFTHGLASKRPEQTTTAEVRRKMFLNVFLEQGLHLPQLKSLELHLSPEHHKGGRPDRPCYLHIDIITFLHAHRKTLTTVVFRNVVFSTVAPTELIKTLGIPLPPVLVSATASTGGKYFHAPAITTLEITLDLLGHHFPNLQHCQWLVPRFRHHPRCKHPKEFPVMHGPSFACGQYQTLQLAATGFFDLAWVGAFAAFAEKVGVEVDEESQVWNFGTAITQVLRMKENE